MLAVVFGVSEQCFWGSKDFKDQLKNASPSLFAVVLTHVCVGVCALQRLVRVMQCSHSPICLCSEA